MSQNTTGLFLYHNTTEEGCRHDRRVSPPVEGQWHTAGNQRSGIQKDPASCLLVTCLRTVYKQLNKSKCTPGGARLRSDNMPSPRSLPLQGLSHLAPSHPSPLLPNLAPPCGHSSVGLHSTEMCLIQPLLVSLWVGHLSSPTR